MPSRLEFYENWLNPDGLRVGTIGLAPLSAVLSFLRQEGEPYRRVMAYAGTCAADWLLAAHRMPRRVLFRRLPAGLRARIAARTARRLIRECHRRSRVSISARGGEWTFVIDGSVFCAVREPVGSPLCGFYEALAGRTFHTFGLAREVRATKCRAMGSSTCELSVLTGSPTAAEAEDVGHGARP